MSKEVELIANKGVKGSIKPISSVGKALDIVPELSEPLIESPDGIIRKKRHLSNKRDSESLNFTNVDSRKSKMQKTHIDEQKYLDDINQQLGVAKK